MAKRLLALMIAGLLASCAPQPEASRTPAPPSPAPATPGPAGQSDDLSAWKLLRPKTPDQPPPIQADGLNYRLRPDWQIETISYDYEWSGFGGETSASALVARDGAGYQRDGAAIPAEDVKAFAATLDNLYPVQGGLSAIIHTDDYPDYRVTIAGADGQEIVISSGNTANPFGAPWTISAGGQLFAQYDGALVPPLAKLLGAEARLPGPEADLAGDILFESSDFPSGGYQSDTSAKGVGIDYQAQPPAIAGTIYLDDAAGAPEQIDLKKPDESSALCEWSADERRSGGGDSAFAFNCKVPEAAAGQDYAYALFIAMAGQGPVIVRLTGTWAEPFDARLLPPPIQWQAAAAVDPTIQELLRDHLLLNLSYGATVDPADPLTATLEGDALLIGQTELEGRPVRYSVETPFAIKDGALTRWDLDRASLEALLADALAQPLTQRVLAADPRAVINLRYIAKPVPETEVRSAWSCCRPAQQVDILPCGAVPGGTFPSATAPLRGWSYNQAFAISPRETEFLLIDGRLVAANLDLSGPDDERFPGALYAVLAPEGLAAPVDRIWLATDSFWGDKPVLTIWGASDEQLAPLKLPPATDGDEWAGVTLRVDADGRLRPEVCR